jgi:hypothetical protein
VPRTRDFRLEGLSAARVRLAMLVLTGPVRENRDTDARVVDGQGPVPSCSDTTSSLLGEPLFDDEVS